MRKLSEHARLHCIIIFRIKVKSPGLPNLLRQCCRAEDCVTEMPASRMSYCSLVCGYQWNAALSLPSVLQWQFLINTINKLPALTLIYDQLSNWLGKHVHNTILALYWAQTLLACLCNQVISEEAKTVCALSIAGQVQWLKKQLLETCSDMKTQIFDRFPDSLPWKQGGGKVGSALRGEFANFTRECAAKFNLHTRILGKVQLKTAQFLEWYKLLQCNFVL